MEIEINKGTWSQRSDSITELHQISRCDSCQQLNEDCNLIDGECSNCDTETHLRAAYEQKLEDSRNDF